MNEELDSQLSAMFDDELPSVECELLARRLSRDEQLKARWGRYAVMGAVLRSERGVRLNAPLARRVSAVLLAEPALAAPAPASARNAGVRWWQPLAATGLAAGVAAASVLWLRAQAPLQGTAAMSAQLPVAPRAVAALNKASLPELRSKALQVAAPVIVPPIELANYVVAHSMFSAPVAGHSLLSTFMSEGGAPVEAPVADVTRSAQ
jgi:sigma-E factor negative regulatory protein RseA